jgi:glycine cleavage system aminomethyltransferase T
VGTVPSGECSVTFNTSVSLGYVEPKYEKLGTKLTVEIYGERLTAIVGSEPLFDLKNERLCS